MRYYSFFSSIGNGKTPLNSFDSALLNSKIANYNLVKISSILPPGLIPNERIELGEGSILYTAYSHITAQSDMGIVSAAVGVAIPEDSTKAGVIMEFSGFCPAKESRESVKKMLIEAMQNRKSKIKDIRIASSETIPNGEDYSTAFAGISLW